MANPAAIALIKACRLRWDLCISDHVPIEIEMDLERYGAEVKLPKMQAPFPEQKRSKNDRKDKEHQRDQEWNKAWATVTRRFAAAEARQDVEEFHRLWCIAATKMLRAITDTERRGAQEVPEPGEDLEAVPHPGR